MGGQPDGPCVATGLHASEQMRGAPACVPIVNRQWPTLSGSGVPPTATGACLQSESLPQNCVHSPFLPPPGKRHCVVRTHGSTALPLEAHMLPTGSAPAERQTLRVASKNTHFSSAGHGLCVVG